ncbi:MAG: nucleoside-diphosphate sugar epimerase/dehydratase [Pseudomonadota bacterium]
MLLNFIKSLSRTRKRWIIAAIDLSLIPFVFAFCYMMQAEALTRASGWAGLLEFFQLLLPVAPYLLLAALALAFWFELPQVRLKHFEGRAVLRYAAFAGSTALVHYPLSLLFGVALPMSTYVLFGLSYFFMGTLVRTTLRTILIELYARAVPRRRVLIYGAGATGTELATALRANDTIDPVAFVDDNASLQGLIISGLSVYAPAQLKQIAKERDVERVLLAIPSLPPAKQIQIARRVQEMGLDIQVLPSFSQLIGDEDLIEKFISVPSRSLLGRQEVDAPLGPAGECYRGRSVLISGAGGTIGSELARQVLGCGPRRIVLYELSEFALYTVDMELRQLATDATVEIVPILGSVTDARLVRKCLVDYEVDVVLHAAAYKHVPLVEANQLAGLVNNVIGTHILARESYEAGIERFLLISTDKAVRPQSVMGASKRFAELIVQDLASRVLPGEGPRYSMVRFGNVLGSSGSVIPLFQDQIRRGGPVTVTHPDVTRYFMTVQEAAKLVLTAGAMAEGGEVFVLDMGKPVSILALARQTIEASGYTVRDTQHPDGDIAVEIIGLRPGEKMHEELTITGAQEDTAHAKIFSVREARLSELEVARSLAALRAAIETLDARAACAAISSAVEVERRAEDRHTQQ